ncbi:ABC transporter substrate-binding protein [Pannonibacter sp. Q-1]|uniref:ABC transporter substrate-binding protein n=1 Tax=Pannonibacter TaxID=227873 RepID=UPI00067BE48F|nr:MULTISPECIES: ABC transporter substrate-binding protein [Pannonibacter]KND19679.1 ABC transporter permease [Pannonibacter phragmitetus]MBA4206950.1 ABC transporter permease [Polymorphum sp.]
MNFKAIALGTALALGGAAPFTVQTAAAEGNYIPLLTYRTGAFAGSGIHIANGMYDYLQMLNERDGGIGGVKIILEECETGYDPQKGMECYEATKGKGALMYNPYSTGTTLQIIPKAGVDKIPVLSMGYGLSAAAVGNTFPWVFNVPDTYWDGLSVIIKYIGEQEGGMDKLKGKKIGYIFLDAGFGREPIPLLEQLSKDYGFEVTQYPVPAKEMQNQSSQWLNIRRDRPDYVIMWGWGAMNPTAIKEAVKTRFPMDKMIGVWWSAGDDDAAAGGAGAKGYKALNISGLGTDYPALADIKKLVVDARKSQTTEANFGNVLYNRGVLNSVLMAEAIRTAQEKTGKTVLTGEDVRIGLESLNITAERLEEIGLAGFAHPMKVTCEDHAGSHPVYIQEWDGTKWVKATDWIEPMKDVVRPLLEAAAKEYTEKNAPWPARTEPCPN